MRELHRHNEWALFRETAIVIRLILFFFPQQKSISIGPLVLYIASFVSTVCVKRINKFIGEKVLRISNIIVEKSASEW